jgi:hypothetical protein
MCFRPMIVSIPPLALIQVAHGTQIHIVPNVSRDTIWKVTGAMRWIAGVRILTTVKTFVMYALILCLKDLIVLEIIV